MIAYGIAGAIVVVLGGVYAAACGSGSPPPPRTHSASGAEYICEQFAKERLRAPSTAKFPARPPTPTEQVKEGRYKVQTHVDAENAFGATLRSKVGCVVEWAGDDEWKLIDLRIE